MTHNYHNNNNNNVADGAINNDNSATGIKGQIRRAIFPGSFNPFTRGHQSLVDRALELFDEIVIAVGVSFDKHSADDISLLVEPIAELYADNPRVTVTHYQGLTVDAAKTLGCKYVLRGVRNAIDLEYERTMADANRMLSGIETVILLTFPQYAMISSSLVRELRHYGHDVSELMPVK